MESDKHQEEMDESSLLSKAGRHQVFHTPSGYFEKLPGDISSRIHQPQPELVRKFIPLHLFAAAACLLLIVAAGIIYIKFPDGKEKEAAALTYDDIYNSGMITQMDEAMLMDVITTSENNSDNASGVTSEDQQLHEYLIENNTDINLIISEL